MQNASYFIHKIEFQSSKNRFEKRFPLTKSIGQEKKGARNIQNDRHQRNKKNKKKINQTFIYRLMFILRYLIIGI